jgi:hypothetical protein
VADTDTAAVLRGYFGRPNWHQSIGCAKVEIDTDIGRDLLVDEGGADPGVFTKAHELLRPFQKSHSNALVILDCEYEGSPGKEKIVGHITENLVRTGWTEKSVRVIAIEPELESWLWQDKPQISVALSYDRQPPLRQFLLEKGWWPADSPKPPRPKEAVQWVLELTRKPRSSAIYERIASGIAVKGCVDSSFCDLREIMQSWFPIEDM